MQKDKLEEPTPKPKEIDLLATIWRLRVEMQSLKWRLDCLQEQEKHFLDKAKNLPRGGYAGFLDPFEPTVVAVVDENGVNFWRLTNLEDGGGVDNVPF